MSKLEISVRKHLHLYMSDLKKGRYWPMGRVGVPLDRDTGAEYVTGAFADVEDGLCTDITIYASENGLAARHYYMYDGVVSITKPLCDYLDDPDMTYDDLVTAICQTIRKHAAQADAAVQYTGELISLVEYAAMHGKTSAGLRQLALRGRLKSAVKIGRNWLIRKDEPYPERKWREH